MPDLGLIFGGSAIFATVLTLVIVGVTCLGTLASFALVGGILWVTLRPLLQNSQKRAAILQNGIPATALIVQLSETGMLVNNQPQVKIVLQVNPPNGAPYQTDLVMIVSYLQIPRIQPGLVVPVKIDPANPANVALAI